MQLYDWALGVTPPKANDSIWNQILTYMWKSEMLGIFSEVLSPFQGSGQITTSLYPAIHKNAQVLGTNIMNVATNKKTLWQGLDDALRGTFSAWNQSNRLLERGLANQRGGKARYFKNQTTISKLKSEFQKDRGIEKPNLDHAQTVRTKYYRAFKDSFNKGANSEEVARKWLAALFAVKDSFVKDSGYKHRSAMKAALSEMNKQIEKLSPLGGLSDDTNKKKVISTKQDFSNWLNPKIGTTGNKKLFEMVGKQINEYMYKKRQLKKAIINYRNKYGLSEFFPLLKSEERKLVL